ncbi:MAG: phospho-sugar mutase [bacterium]|nr:phospho-sugar mutase [bacterium]
MDPQILQTAQAWANEPAFDAAFKAEIKALIDAGDEKELTDRFYKDLEFGTGGLRGILGAGSNRMNIYTVRRANQGLADYLAQAGIRNASVVIAYDCRRMSDQFSRESASVLAANGIKVYLFDSLRPTPMLSFAVRHLKATAGIVVTASHNPPEYNGYKVSWDDGCQVTAPHDQGIIDRVNGITDWSSLKTLDFDQAVKEGKIEIIGEGVDEAYYRRVMELSLGDVKDYKDFGVVYTPLHGAGNLPVREALKRAGFERVTVVPSQELPDGEFPTVAYPNPEEGAAMEEAVKTAGPEDQLILATDPDADRIGAMVRQNGEWLRLNGNQIGQLLLDFYLEALVTAGKLPQSGHYITTIVTSTLGAKIAQAKGLKTHEVLTGFKYIGAVMAELETQPGETYVFGTEESHGYLFGDFVRDKDAVSACMIFAEMAATLKAQGKTVMVRLDELHQQFGYHSDELLTQTYKGKEGAEQIQKILLHFRKQPPQEIGGVALNEIRDYQNQVVLDAQGKTKGQLDLPKSNVLAFLLADGSRITLRPSGTEPKVKFYFNLTGKDAQGLDAQKERYVRDITEQIAHIN